MNPRECIKTVAIYISGADLFMKHFDRERVILQESTGRTDLSISDVNPLQASHAYLLRLMDFPRLSLTLASRWTGIDLVLKGSKRLLGR